MKTHRQLTEPNDEISHDQKLLNQIIQGSASSPEIYSPGSYWLPKTENAVYQLSKHGMSNFRSSENSAITSFGDNPTINILNSLSTKPKDKLKRFLFSVKPFKDLFESQVSLTRQYFLENLEALNAYYEVLPRVSELLEKYKINFDTTLGGCETFLNYGDYRVSHIYLKLLDTLDYMNSSVNLSKVRSVIEIGGGFGVNVDLQIQFFPSIRKILYVDIAPNLYVGTQYLKTRYPTSVIDFQMSRDLDKITFKNDDSLEIFCILPMQIEKVNAKFDLFHNAHSFVEMTPESVVNYARQAQKLLNDSGRIYLVTYDGYDDLTISPEELGRLVSPGLSISKKPTLRQGRFDYHWS
jgi:putative sugar O-methyltransferase